MLGVRVYPRSFIEDSRSKVEADVAAYETLVASTDNKVADAFEADFFNDMVIVLDRLFVHRLRGVEGKEHNALAEVRMLCDSLVEHGGVMTADKTVKFTPDKSILKHNAGEPIHLTATDFDKLYRAFFDEMIAKFTESAA